MVYSCFCFDLFESANTVFLYTDIVETWAVDGAVDYDGLIEDIEWTQETNTANTINNVAPAATISSYAD